MGGTTEPCVQAVMELAMHEDRPATARIVSAGTRHAFAFRFDDCREVIVKDGFGSGYGGEGARGLVRVLRLLAVQGWSVDEIEVPQATFTRIIAGTPTIDDHDLLWGRATRSFPPSESKILGNPPEPMAEESIWNGAPMMLPAAILDRRLHDIAAKFWSDPDAAVMKAHRRLEDAIRNRTGNTAIGTSLYSAVFHGDKAALVWEGLTDGERAARANLFCGAYGAHRNPSMHNERKRDTADCLSEFLVVNELYRLEARTKLVVALET